MDRIATSLINCFQTVFPDMPASEIPTANQSSVATWDSVAAITLVNVIEEEFGIQMDLDHLAELDSFNRIEEYLRKETPVP
jgi:acyl carrier protein